MSESELDRDDDAAAEVETVRRLIPDYTLENVDRIYPYRTKEARDRFIGGLRKAGLPEEGPFGARMSRQVD